MTFHSADGSRTLDPNPSRIAQRTTVALSTPRRRAISLRDVPDSSSSRMRSSPSDTNTCSRAPPDVKWLYRAENCDKLGRNGELAPLDSNQDFDVQSVAGCPYPRGQRRLAKHSHGAVRS